LTVIGWFQCIQSQTAVQKSDLIGGKTL
jgi:hypothetical protein